MQSSDDGGGDERKPGALSVHMCLPYSGRRVVGLPEECAENNGSDTRAPDASVASRLPPVTPECGDGDPGGEPEDHGHGLDSQDGKLVGCAGEATWGKDEVYDGQDGPDGGEEHKVDAMRRPRGPRGGVRIDDVGGETEDDDGEQSLHNTQRENGDFEEGHGGWVG